MIVLFKILNCLVQIYKKGDHTILKFTSRRKTEIEQFYYTYSCNYKDILMGFHQMENKLENLNMIVSFLILTRRHLVKFKIIWAQEFRSFGKKLERKV
jgi:hypothetical protein